ncbi:metal-dependent hydrolase [Longimicrobium sp.]|uniref:metal-dependent hydrolase n=1 Tax=Longimicrobium sp. TaxID=2029185 RepID=UPI002C1B7BF4|nr:metal-dependent hydrolase [Longimicrobium sp.]HSU13484.1 metal-dependent hydrolase [Longimicrobium sp.]
MFLGHTAAALAGKRAAPRTSFGILLGAAIFLDLLWPVFLLLGWERVRIDPGNTAFTPLDFVSYPISHSLVAALGWSVLAGGVYYAVTRYGFGAWTVGCLVLSHWVLDWLTHRPDLPLWPGSAKVGLGMWHSLPLTLAVELLLFAVGLLIYLGTTRARDGVGRWVFWALMAFYLIVYAANTFGPPPPDVRTVAWMTLAMWLLPLWGWWADAHREVTPQIPQTAFGAVPRPAG